MGNGECGMTMQVRWHVGTKQIVEFEECKESETSDPEPRTPRTPDPTDGAPHAGFHAGDDRST